MKKPTTEDPYDPQARLDAWIRIWYSEPPTAAIDLGCAGPLAPDRQQAAVEEEAILGGER